MTAFGDACLLVIEQNEKQQINTAVGKFVARIPRSQKFWVPVLVAVITACGLIIASCNGRNHEAQPVQQLNQPNTVVQPVQQVTQPVQVFNQIFLNPQTLSATTNALYPIVGLGTNLVSGIVLDGKPYMLLGSANITTNGHNEVAVAERYVNAAKAAALIPDFTNALALIMVPITAFEAAGSNSLEFPDGLVNQIYGLAATTLHGMGRDSEAIEYAKKPMMIRQNAGAAALKVFSLLWQSNNVEAATLLNNWFDVDLSDPTHPVFKPKLSPQPPAMK